MKKIYFILSVTLLCASCGPTTVVQSDSYQPAPTAPVEEVSYQSFYDQLSPYGNWINYPGYGYVWSPNAGPDFQPYATNGNWIYTNAGWTWASNYNWGWAPFHYGRWFYENGYGWMWVPGSEWAPAWVSWRSGGDYYGWAPLGPSVSVNMALNNYNPPAYYWNFVPRRYMGDPNWHNYYVPGNRNVTIINNTTVINNYSGTDRSRYAYAPGPDPNEVRRYSGNNFTPVQLRQSSTPGARFSGSQYQIYQPRVSATPSNRGDASVRPANPAPVRYESFNNMRSSNQNPGGQTANNQRPAVSNPSYNQPANNQRPATTNPANNQPVNNQPVYNPRAVPSNPGNNQPVNNQPVYNQPVYNPRSVPANPGNNQPVNNQPVNNPRPGTVNPGNNQPVNNPRSNTANPGNNEPAENRPTYNQRPAAPGGSYNPPANTPPVNNVPAGNTKPSIEGDRRINHNNQSPVRPATNPAIQRPQSNTPQTSGQMPVNRNSNNPHPDPKPEAKPVAPPKTREANND